MDFPDMSQYPDSQRFAIDSAKKQGDSIFLLNGIEYRIEKDGENFKVRAFSGDVEIGLASTGTIGKHYALRVNSEFQGKGIGKILFQTKVALDGILDSEWSGRYSRIYFLMKMGYVPTGHASRENDPRFDYPLGKDELRAIKQGIKSFCNNRGIGGNGDGCPFSVRLKYDPIAAHIFLQFVGI